MSILLRAALLGFATGGRSTLGLAALAVTVGNSGGWPTNRWITRLAVLAAAGELTGDKLPRTPSRLSPPGVGFRHVLGTASGAILSQRAGNSRFTSMLAGLAGAAGAVAGTWLGARWRGLAATKLGPDWPGAVAEDALDVAVAYLAARS